MQPELFHLHAEVELDHWWFVARRQIMSDLLAAALTPHPDRVVIDVGCGTGANIAALANRYTAVGIDTTADAIDLAKERFPGVRFICGQAPQDLGTLAGRADAFLLMDVLEHVPDDKAVLAPLVQVLKPGGYLLITVPADMRLWSQHDVSFGHYRRYDMNQFCAIWQSLPVRQVMTSYFNARLYPLIRGVRTLSRLLGKSWGRSGSDLSVPAKPVNRFLQRVFAAESPRLVDLSRGHGTGYRHGVSLIALLQREDPGRHPSSP